MAEFVLKYADTRGEVHNQVAQGATEQEIRDRFTRQGFLVYSVKPKQARASASPVRSVFRAGAESSTSKNS